MRKLPQSTEEALTMLEIGALPPDVMVWRVEPGATKAFWYSIDSLERSAEYTSEWIPPTAVVHKVDLERYTSDYGMTRQWAAYVPQTQTLYVSEPEHLSLYRRYTEQDQPKVWVVIASGPNGTEPLCIAGVFEEYGDALAFAEDTNLAHYMIEQSPLRLKGDGDDTGV